ncbi:MAG: hypothetical protein IPN92_16660 [Chromatiaceae bacterium]|nr:hypothetical protein [Chromatiaceae bacterium]
MATRTDPRVANNFDPPQDQGISVRERDVLNLIIAGKANKVIAWDLGTSVRTIETHRANLMRKLQALGSGQTAKAGGAWSPIIPGVARGSK